MELTCMISSPASNIYDSMSATVFLRTSMFSVKRLRRPGKSRANPDSSAIDKEGTARMATCHLCSGSDQPTNGV